METPVLVLGRGFDDQMEGSWFWFSLLLLRFAPNSGLLSKTLRGYLYNRGMEG